MNRIFQVSVFVTLLAGATAQSVDQCANLISKVIAVTVEPGLPPVSVGVISACLCVSQIPTFLASNVVARAAVSVAGTAAATSSLVNLITSSTTYQICTYPEHASGHCSAANVCTFTCGDGYSTGTGTCTCESPNTECNGQCGNYPSCNSKRAAMNDLEGLLRREPQLFKRRYAPKKTELTKEAKVQWKADQGKRIGQFLGCRDNWEACGVFGGSRSAWECVDTMNDLESCGGCTVPLLSSKSMPSLDDLMTFGTDCTSLPGVADVACLHGKCAVLRCERGWALSTDGKQCHPIHSTGANKHGHTTEGGDADAYGLEHVPLGNL